jgi:hypothetical protein
MQYSAVEAELAAVEAELAEIALRRNAILQRLAAARARAVQVATQGIDTAINFRAAGGKVHDSYHQIIGWPTDLANPLTFVPQRADIVACDGGHAVPALHVPASCWHGPSGKILLVFTPMGADINAADVAALRRAGFSRGDHALVTPPVVS